MLSIVIASLLACPGPKDEDDDETPESQVCDPHELTCEDDLVSLLLNEDKDNEGSVTTTVDGSDFVTQVDATAGGMNTASQRAWVYLRFTEDGAEKVSITDGDSLSNTEWHMALRRYNLRLNSGVSGPSCVMGAQVDGAYADVASADGAELAEEAFLDESCEVVSDRHGLGDPAYVLNTWWAYTECIEPTGQAFVVQLEDGSQLKLAVESYYEDGAACSSAETGWITLRWAFL